MHHLEIGALSRIATAFTASESSLLFAQAVIKSQCAPVDLLALKSLHALGGALLINEVGMSESSWLASTSVNGNTDVNDISNITEELVEIGIGHLEGKVADEEGLGWRVRHVLTAGPVLVVDY